MPKKKNLEDQNQQSQRFEKVVSDMVAAGELSRTAADAALDKLVKTARGKS